MLEYFAYKKYKKNKAEKEDPAKVKNDAEAGNGKDNGKKPAMSAASSSVSTPAGAATPAPVLKPADESFLQSLVADADAAADDDEGPPPPLPPRVRTPELQWEHSDDERSRKSSAESARGVSSSSSAAAAKKDSKTAKVAKVANRLSVLLLSRKDAKKPPESADGHLAPPGATSGAVAPLSDAERERRDMNKVLDDLNLAARGGTAFSLSAESTELVRKFTLVLRDLVNGVPTAYDDLRRLLDDRDNILAKNFEKLPSSMKKLVAQLPDKMTGGLGPELLAAAAASQGLQSDASGGFRHGVKKLLVPHNLQELVTKPGAVVGMLRAIMNALKVRWPAFMGTNVIWSVAIFLLLFVLWYCHKRGREVRLEKEKLADAIDGSDRVEELPDDPALPAPASGTAPAITTTPAATAETSQTSSRRK